MSDIQTVDPHTLLSMKRVTSRVYAFGSNSAAQLGIGTTQDTTLPQTCVFTSLFTDLNAEQLHGQPGRISKIAAGGNHTLILSAVGDIHASGCVDADDGRKWSPTDTPELGFAYQWVSNMRILFCSAPWEASVIANKTSILTQGKGPRGELASGSVIDSPNWQIIPRFPPSGTHIVDLASSVDHTVVVLSNGEAWGWGNGRKGKLGEPAKNEFAPRKIQNLGFHVVRAVCGREFTYFVGEPLEGRHVVLGSDKWMIKSNAPPAVPDWIEIGASWGSILVLKADGMIVSWGRNDHGQLAPSGLPKIKHIAVGSEHTLALTYDGAVLSWGWGEHGNCGPDIDKAGDVKDRWNEVALDIENSAEIVGVGAGCATSFIVVETNQKDDFNKVRETESGLR